MNQRPKVGSELSGAGVHIWVRAALSKPRCLEMLDISITPFFFRNLGTEQLGTDFGKTGLKASI
jgi:hypothetical protein